MLIHPPPSRLYQKKSMVNKSLSSKAEEVVPWLWTPPGRILLVTIVLVWNVRMNSSHQNWSQDWNRYDNKLKHPPTYMSSLYHWLYIFSCHRNVNKTLKSSKHIWLVKHKPSWLNSTKSTPMWLNKTFCTSVMILKQEWINWNLWWTATRTLVFFWTVCSSLMAKIGGRWLMSKNLATWEVSDSVCVCVWRRSFLRWLSI